MGCACKFITQQHNSLISSALLNVLNTQTSGQSGRFAVVALHFPRDDPRSDYRIHPPVRCTQEKTHRCFSFDFLIHGLVHHTNWWGQIHQTNWPGHKHHTSLWGRTHHNNWNWWGQIHHTNWWGQICHTFWWSRIHHINWWTTSPKFPKGASYTRVYIADSWLDRAHLAQRWGRWLRLTSQSVLWWPKFCNFEVLVSFSFENYHLFPLVRSACWVRKERHLPFEMQCFWRPRVSDASVGAGGAQPPGKGSAEASNGHCVVVNTPDALETPDEPVDTVLFSHFWETGSRQPNFQFRQTITAITRPTPDATTSNSFRLIFPEITQRASQKQMEANTHDTKLFSSQQLLSKSGNFPSVCFMCIVSACFVCRFCPSRWCYDDVGPECVTTVRYQGDSRSHFLFPPRQRSSLGDRWGHSLPIPVLGIITGE